MVKSLCMSLVLLTSITAAGQGWGIDYRALGENIKNRAQERAEKFDNYTCFGVSPAYLGAQDTKMSLQIYSGAGLGIKRERLRTSDQNLLWSKTELVFSLMGSSSNYPNFYEGARFNYELSFLARTRWLKSQLYLGGGLGVLNDFKRFAALGNSGIYNDFAVGLRPVAMFLHKSTIRKRDAWFFARMCLNVFSYVNRIPTYALFSDGATHYFIPLGKFNRIHFEMGYSRLRKWSLENRRGLTYSWDFYSINEQKGMFNAVNGQHLITFSWWTKTR